MIASGAARILSGIAHSACRFGVPSSTAALGGTALIYSCESWVQYLNTIYFGSGTSIARARLSTQPPGPLGSLTIHATPATLANNSNRENTAGSQDLPGQATISAAAAPSSCTIAGVSPSSGPTSEETGNAATSAVTAASPSGPVSRRDKSASADVVYPSSHDDNLGVQRNWFNALFTQLTVMQRTGMTPHLKGRQKEVFEAVEREFEGLWERNVRGKGLEGVGHRGMLMCCLAIATHKVLLYETGDDALVREVVRTNLGGTAVGIMMRLHKIRLWLLLRLLAEDPYKQAVRFLPSLQGDMGSLVSGQVAQSESEATWTAASCGFHSVLAAEGAAELLPEFCCQFGMQWLEVFSQYGVRVGLEESLGFGDECCVVRISRPGSVEGVGVGGSSGSGGSGGTGSG